MRQIVAKENPYHDPATGQFTSPSGSGPTLMTGNGVIYDKHGVQYTVKHEYRSIVEGLAPKHQYRVINDQGHEVAGMTLKANGQSAMEVHTSPAVQRRGIATALYDHVEKHLGYKLKSNWATTDDGAAFWKARSK